METVPSVVEQREERRLQGTVPSVVEQREERRLQGTVPSVVEQREERRLQRMQGGMARSDGGTQQ